MMKLSVLPALLCLLLTACSNPRASDSVQAEPSDKNSVPAQASGKSWRDPQPPVDPPANQPAAGPAFLARATEDRAHAEGRGRDQQSNPDYIQRTAPWVLDYIASGQADQKILHDPYRIDWGQTRGMEQDVEFLNRYGAKLRGKLWGPKLPYTDQLTGETSSGPFPALLFIPGAAPPGPDSPYDGFSSYEGHLQQLAESGYVVFAVSPQGQGGSEYFEPPHPMCDPEGAWKEPQEMGLREQGECAGHNGPLPPLTGEFASLYNLIAAGGPEAATVATVAQSRLEEETAYQFFVEVHDANRTRHVLPALDGVNWLLSSANPWRALIDPDRIGIVGHSAGADAALVAGNGDPLRRFKAVVSWDGYGLPPDSVLPRVPTMLHKGEDQNFAGPYAAPPANHVATPYRNHRRFADENRDSMLVALRGSTHSEWSYIPYALTNPIAPVFNASSRGGQVAHYYTLAWFDRWLKGPEYADDARRRLLARSFDASADRTSIGSGTYDFATQSNVPYRLEGEDVAEHLSVFFLSQIAFDGARCNDVQAECVP